SSTTTRARSPGARGFSRPEPYSAAGGSLAHSGLPPGRHCGAPDFVSAQVDLVDPPRIGNVLERIGVEDDEVAVSPRRDHPGIEPCDVGGIARRRTEIGRG